MLILKLAVSALLLRGIADLLMADPSSIGTASGGATTQRLHPPNGAQDLRKLLDDNCVEHWFTQPLDHFTYMNSSAPQPTTYQQRYYVCDQHWQQRPDGGRGPIFFYAGNEGSVTHYLHATGLMFENAQAFGAAMVFAEHRYYGESQPYGPYSWAVNPTYLTSGQAMADYAALLTNLTSAWGARDSPIIAFGGSYGGILAAWLRRSYPHIITGAVASSAPVGAFPGVQGGFDPTKFWQVVTRDATAAGGAAPLCAGAVRAGYALMWRLAETAEGREVLQQRFRLCEPLEDVTALGYWIQGAFDAYAMGNYPYPSDYIAGSQEHPMPAWPVRAACDALMNIAPSCAHQALASAAAAAATSAPVPHPAGQVAHESDHSKEKLVTVANSREQRQHQQQGLFSASKRKLMTAWRADATRQLSGFEHPQQQQQTETTAAAAAAMHEKAARSFRMPVVDVMSACGKEANSGSAAAGAPAAHTGADTTSSSSSSSRGEEEALQLLDGLREAVALLYNVTGQATCFSLDIEGPAAASVGPWDYQFCTEQMSQEQPYFPTTGVTDMFWDQGPFDVAGIDRHCQQAWGLTPRQGWMVTEHGGYDYRGVSNILFPNGLLDPWSAYGYFATDNPGIVPITIPNGAHHVDLMFSHPDDTPDIKQARATMLSHVHQWIMQACPQCQVTPSW